MTSFDPDQLLARYQSGEISRAQFAVEFSCVRWSEEGDRKNDDGTSRPHLSGYRCQMEPALWREVLNLYRDRRDDRGILSVIHRYSSNRISREEMVGILGNWNYLPSDRTTDGYDPLLIPVRGSWDDILLADDLGLISEADYAEIYALSELRWIERARLNREQRTPVDPGSSAHETLLRRYENGEITRAQFVVEMADLRWSETGSTQNDKGEPLPLLQDFRFQMDEDLWLEISRIVVDRRFNLGLLFVCQRFADGKISREELVSTLGSWNYLPSLPPSDEFGDPNPSVKGSWDDILFAVHSGLIPKDVYGDILKLMHASSSSPGSVSEDATSE